ncbi:MAG TPA: EF-hand domain-containing protein [Lysobacter sp.]
MSRNNPRNSAGMLGVALAGLVLSGSAFAMQPLAQGYMLAAGHVAAEGKCGEGKCGASEATASKDAEGKCGEGKCGASEAKAPKAAVAKAAEGKCGEGQCGDARFNKTDTNDDGRVSKAEYLAVVPNGQGWSDKDANGDGFISEREAYDYTKARFEANGKKLPIGRFAAFPE